MILLVLSLAWILGIFAGSLLDLPIAFFLLAVVPLPFLFVRRYRKTAVLVVLSLALFAGAALYSHGA